MLKKFGWFFIFSIPGFWFTDLQAQQTSMRGGLTDVELAALPQYCHARLAGDAEIKKLWQQRMGRENFVHLHHYCYGLNEMNRARLVFDKEKRNGHLKKAIHQFNYVLKPWPANFRLAIEAQNYKNQAEMMLTQP